MLLDDQRGHTPAHLDACAERRPHMHLNDSRSDFGKIVASEEEKEAHRSHRDRERNGDEDVATSDHPFQQRAIALAELVEALLESLLKADEDIP